MKVNRVMTTLRSLFVRIFAKGQDHTVSQDRESVDTMLDMTYHMCRRRHQELLAKIEMQRQGNDDDRSVIDNFLRPTSA